MGCTSDGCGLPAAAPPYGGDCGTRRTLTGDWGGARNSLASSGIVFQGDVTQIYQGVASGGVRQTWNYAAHGDYLLLTDFDKLAGVKGLSLMIRAEHRMGEFIARDAGVILPPALHATTPVPDSNDLIITNFLFTQNVNENVTVLFGKLDTLDGDRNPFASGRGKTGFMHTSIVEPISGIPTVPFSTLGAGVILSVDGNPFAQFLVLNGTDTTTTAGFDELFENGVALVGAVNLPSNFGGKLGIHTLSGAWNSGTFNSIRQDPRVILPIVPLRTTDDSWVLWYSGSQFLSQDPTNPMKGWGLFGRFGVAKGQTSPIEYFGNAGVGGASPIRGRDEDQWGIGWFYSRNTNEFGPVATNALGIGNFSTGVEIFYNYAVTPHFKVTPDLQIIMPDPTFEEQKASLQAQSEKINARFTRLWIPGRRKYIACESYRLGFRWQELGEFEEAVNSFQRAIDAYDGQRPRKSKDSKAAFQVVAACHNHIGMIYLEVNEFPAATKRFTEAIKLRRELKRLFPEDRENQVYLGGALCNIGLATKSLSGILFML
ncbi:carbohydrate porin [Thalassoglobus neptunius]|uniref:carbohydrate porin n=1 Tax=Thalassoglobus neptunius TaxID=1938619 RepID=UPI0018D217E7|nr:carbohydrate porin [Thalassoglobus neptunius]